MIKINYTPYKNFYKKNILYKINESCIVPFKEEHEDKKAEIVNLSYDLKENQYGFFAYEFRNPVVQKEGCKTADVLAGIIDEARKEIHTIILDVKSDISAFSDNLQKNGALLTVIKNVRKFACQIQDEKLHKDSFILYYKADGFTEDETLGIVTASFEKEKFAAAADLLERLLSDENGSVAKLVDLKLKNNLRPYENEIGRLRDFSREKIRISGQAYDLHVFLLEKVSALKSVVSVEVAL